MSSLRENEFEAEELMAYLDGELEPQRAAALVAHLEHCADCQALAKEFRQTSERLLEFQIEPPSSAMDAAIYAAIDNLNAEPKKPSESAGEVSLVARIFASRYGWIAACAAIIAAVALVISLSNTPSPSSEIAQKQVAIDAKSRELATLSDKGIDVAQLASRSAITGRLAAPQLQVAPQASAIPTQPMIARTASLTIVPSNYDQASAAIQALATAHGGYAQSLSTQSQADSARSVSATLRVPIQQMDALLADLRKLGHVNNESQNNADVTSEYVDVDARLKNARATEQRLSDLLATRTGKLEDVLDVERELARVRGEIESMDAQRTLLLHRVDYATVDVQLSEQYQEHVGSGPTSSGTTIWNATVDGFNYMTAGMLSLLVFLLAYGPSILFWSLLILVPGWFVWRKYRPQPSQTTHTTQ